MEKIFNDERVNAVRGRAMRKTVWFSWIFTLIYTIAVIFVDTFIEGDLFHAAVVEQRFVLSGVLVQVITLLGGAIILLWGELGYFGARKDEMKAYKKNLFYTKGFYAFVYIFAFAYCIHVALNLSYDSYVAFPKSDMPYGFFPSMLLECGGLFLIFSLKSEKVMLNPSEIEGRSALYFKKVFLNILKFGGLCALFTLFAALLFLLLSKDPISATCLGILLAGLATWLALSLEYFMLSLMERLSEKAQEKGRLSATTLLTYIFGACMSVYMSAMCINLNYFAEINSAAVAALYSYTSMLLDRGILLMLAFFIMYFCSETARLQSNTLIRRGRALNIIIISNLCFDVFYIVIKAIAGAKFFDFEAQRLCQETLLFVNLAIDALFAIAFLVCLIPVLQVLSDKKLLPKISTAVAIIYTALYVFARLMYGFLLRAPLSVIGICLPAVIFIWLGIYVVKWFKNIKFSC